MTNELQITIKNTQNLLHALRDLGTMQAPPSLLTGVLQHTIGDSYSTLITPLGPVFVAFNERGISSVTLASDEAGVEEWFYERFGRPLFRAPAFPPALARALGRRMVGEQAALRFDLRGISEFERAVLLKALEIPYGEVRSYSWVAKEIGRPRAVRAVGTALAHNPIPLLIPCHRVVREDGHIGNYSLGGRVAKATVLRAEGNEPEMLEQLAGSRTRYLGSATTHIYCVPTCRQARRISERHRVAFRSMAEASAAGYRPCRICRPAAAS